MKLHQLIKNAIGVNSSIRIIIDSSRIDTTFAANWNNIENEMNTKQSISKLDSRNAQIMVENDDTSKQKALNGRNDALDIESNEFEVKSNAPSNDKQDESIVHLFARQISKIASIGNSGDKLDKEMDSNAYELPNWSQNEAQLRLIYFCLIFNACRRAVYKMDALNTNAKTELNPKFRGILQSFESTSNKFKYLNLEEQISQLINSTILLQFDEMLDTILLHYKQGNATETKIENFVTKRIKFYFSSIESLLPQHTLNWFLLHLFATHSFGKLIQFMVFKLASSDLNNNNNNANNDNSNIDRSKLVQHLIVVFETVILNKFDDINRDISQEARLNRQKTELKEVLKECKLLAMNIGKVVFASTNGMLFKQFEKEKIAINSNMKKKALATPGFKLFGNKKNKKKEESQLAQKEAQYQIFVRNQMKNRNKTQISNSEFAKIAIGFYGNQDISLDSVVCHKSYIKENKNVALKAKSINVGMNSKWQIIKQVMIIRQFDIVDQRTIQFMCQETA